MKQCILSVAIVVATLHATFAQNKTYAGLEASVFSNRFSIQDNGDWLTTTPLSDVQGGINIRQEINTYLFAEAGAIIRPYVRGYSFRSSLVPATSVDYFSWLIPIRIGTNVNLYKEKIFFVPMIGYTLGVNPSSGNQFHSGVRGHRRGVRSWQHR